MWHKKNTNLQTINFSSKEETETFLTNIFHKLNSQQEYNIYLHQIKNYCTFKKLQGSSAIKHKIESIVLNGFEISKYSTLSGTAKLIGSTQNINTDKILNYKYYSHLKHIATCIIAIPKYINIDGRNIEYSSFNGKDAWDFPQELTDEYIKQNKSKPDLHHYKCCLFDSIKDLNKLPSFYLLGIIENDNNSSYSFTFSNNHISNLEQKEVQEHESHVSNLIRKLYEKYQTMENKEIIVKSYLDFESHYEDLSNLDI